MLPGRAQSIQFPDLIVTDKGDTVRCTIKSINQDYITFRRPDSAKGIRTSTVQRRELKYFAKNHYKTAFVVPAGWPVDDAGQPKAKGGLESGHLRFTGGPSWILGAINKKLTDREAKHARAVRSGVAIAVDANGYFSRNVGVGLHTEFFTSSHKDKELDDGVKAVIVSGQLSFRIPFSKERGSYAYLNPGLGIGVASRSSGNRTSQSFRMTVATGTAGVQIEVKPNVGVHLGVMGSTNFNGPSGFIGPSVSTFDALCRIGAMGGFAFLF